MLAYVTGSVDEELRARNEYLVTESRILRNQIQGRIRLTDPERSSLVSATKRLGRKGLEEVVQIVRPETILGWHCRLIAKKFDGSKNRLPGKGGSTSDKIEELVLNFLKCADKAIDIAESLAAGKGSAIMRRCQLCGGQPQQMRNWPMDEGFQ